MGAPSKDHPTPLYLTSLYKRLEIARVLLDHGATANSEDHLGRSPLHLLANGTYDFERDLIRVAGVNDGNKLLNRPVIHATLNSRPLGTNKTNMAVQQIWNDTEEIEREVEEVKCL